MDIFDVLDANKRIRAEELLEDLNTAAMARTTDADGFRKYTDELRKQAGYSAGKQAAEFDESGFEMMRMKLRGGRI